jgi:type IV pilus assembly protein PilW
MGIPPADPNTDVLLVAYGNADSAVEGVQADQAGANPAAQIKAYQNAQSFRTGDKVVGVQTIAGVLQCTMHEVTRVSGANGNCGQALAAGLMVEINVVSYPNSYNACAVQAATKNKAGGNTDASGNPMAALSFSNGAKLYNLGGNPVAKIYAVRGGNLTSCDMFTANCTVATNYQVVANDIVALSAVYGQDFEGNPAPVNPNRVAAGDWSIDRWSRNALADYVQVARTLAVGVQVTARSGLKEKPRTGTACDATASANLPDAGQTVDWYQGYTPVSGSLAGAQINLAAVSADWQCYRYKMFQTTVPIRNMIWRP